MGKMLQLWLGNVQPGCLVILVLKIILVNSKNVLDILVL